MTNELSNPNIQQNNLSSPALLLGSRLKSAREAMGLDQKSAAGQLCLHEKMIGMLESENYPHDLPIIFIRGYIRSYAKLLQIPEAEIAKAMEPLQVKPASLLSMESEQDKPKPWSNAWSKSWALPKSKTNAWSKPGTDTITTSHYFMQIFTCAVALTLVALVGKWWYAHNNSNSNALDTNMNETALSAPATNPVAESQVGSTTPLPSTSQEGDVAAVSATPQNNTIPDSSSSTVPPSSFSSSIATATPAPPKTGSAVIPPASAQPEQAPDTKTASSDENADQDAQDQQEEAPPTKVKHHRHRQSVEYDDPDSGVYD